MYVGWLSLGNPPWRAWRIIPNSHRPPDPTKLSRVASGGVNWTERVQTSNFRRRQSWVVDNPNSHHRRDANTSFVVSGVAVWIGCKDYATSGDSGEVCITDILASGLCWLYATVDTIRDAILTCAQKPTLVSLIYHSEPKPKNVEKRKTKKQTTDMLRSIWEICAVTGGSKQHTMDKLQHWGFHLSQCSVTTVRQHHWIQIC